MKFLHLAGVNASMMRPMFSHRPSKVRPAAFRRWALILEMACSMGLRSDATVLLNNVNDVGRD